MKISILRKKEAVKGIDYVVRRDISDEAANEQEARAVSHVDVGELGVPGGVLSRSTKAGVCLPCLLWSWKQAVN